MHGQAASAHPATPEATLVLVAPAAQARALAALERFEQTIQSVLEAPLDGGRVREWTTLRAIKSA